MTISAFSNGTQSAAVGTEHFLANVNVSGEFTLHVDLSAMLTGDIVELRAYQMVTPSGTARVAFYESFPGLQPTDAQVVFSDSLRNELTDSQALRFSLKQVTAGAPTGTLRDFPWKVLKADAGAADVSSIAAAVWDELIAAHLIAGSAGQFLASRMPTGTVTVGDKTGFSLVSPQNFDLVGNITGTLTTVLNVTNPVGINTGTFINAMADQVWDEPLAQHLVAGSTGDKLYQVTGSSGGGADPWLTALPGSYTPGQAGHILASRMPTGTVLVGDKTGFSLSNPQIFDFIGNITGTISNVLTVANPVGLYTGTLISAIADGVWDETITQHLVVNSAGEKLYSRMPTGTVLVGDKTGFSLANPQAFDLVGNITGTITNVLNVVNPVGLNTGTLIFAIADQVWDESLASHLVAGTTGEKLYTVTGSSAAGSDPWLTALPGSYAAGQAGHILASRMPTGTVIVGSNQDKTGYGLSSPQAFNLVGNITGTVTGNIVGNLSGSVGSILDLAAAAANKIADHVLRRSYANARASADGDAVSFRSLLGAVAKLVNKWSISGTTLTIKHEDDTTTAGTQALTATPGADPITEIDTS